MKYNMPLYIIFSVVCPLFMEAGAMNSALGGNKIWIGVDKVEKPHKQGEPPTKGGHPLKVN
jgi:hypothetical protein